MSLSQALNQFAQNLGRYHSLSLSWELAFTLLDKLGSGMIPSLRKAGN